MKHSAITAHLTKPRKDKTLCNVLSNHRSHFAHYLKQIRTKQTEIIFKLRLIQSSLLTYYKSNLRIYDMASLYHIHYKKHPSYLSELKKNGY